MTTPTERRRMTPPTLAPGKFSTKILDILPGVSLLNPIATAKQTASLLSLAGLAWVISHLPSIPDSALYSDLRRPAVAVLISASVYLLLLGLQAFMHQIEDHPPLRRELGWVIVHAMVLVTVGGSLLRGPRSFALLAGLEGLVSVVSAVSAVALFVYGYSAWVVSRDEKSAGNDDRDRSTPIWQTHALQVFACLPLVLSVVWLEWIPTEQAQQAQFQAGSEI
jgi:hypothetical protein